MGFSRNEVLLFAAAGVAAAVYAYTKLRAPDVPPALDPHGRPVACQVIEHDGRTWEPLQRPVGGSAGPFQQYGVTLRPRAEFLADGLLLSRKRYRDEAGHLSPMDLAIGWGRMSVPGILGDADVGQDGRWYYVTWKHGALPIPPQEMMRSSANVHIIPSTDDVSRSLMALRAGEKIRVTGWLVDVSGPNGFSWNTSLSRTDTGDGACEILYVCSVSAPPEA